MSILLSKSKENSYSSLKLFDPEKKFAPSVHCAYYSCIQLMIHIIHIEEGITFDDIERDFNTWKANPLNTGGTHLFYISKIKSLLSKKGKESLISDFSKIFQLKKTRENSDYKPIAIDSETCSAAITLSEKITSLLSKNFST